MESRHAPLRILIAGAGKMARHHAQAITRSSVPARVVGVADPDPDARQALLEGVPDAMEFADFEEALRETTPEVVHVCTPPSTHAAIALEAIGAACHVYVEKPFAPTEAEARRVFEAAAESGVRVCAGHQLLFERPARETWEVLPALGDLQHIESYFAFRPVRGRGGQAPVRDEEQLLDVLPHPVYVLLEAFEAAGARGPATVSALEIGEGTVHALLRRGGLTACLVVTLTGRPVESYLRLVGTNGSVQADFVRGVVLRQIGPGSSGIDKLLAPYRAARQLTSGTTSSMIRRVTDRKRSYPGLQEIFEAFYSHIRGVEEAPMSAESVLETVRVQERVAEALLAKERRPRDRLPMRSEDVVLVTGGTGFLGTAAVEELRGRGRQVRVLARREPPSWRRIPSVEYVAGDLADGCEPAWLEGVSAVVHCAAATSGGWREHQSASIDASRHLVEGMAAAGCHRLVHVSSIAVVEDEGTAIDETSQLLSDPRSSGPYVWGKLESERLVTSLSAESGIEVTVVRPGAIVDYADFDPPGRLGKRLGNLFIAVGRARERMGIVDRSFCAAAMAQLIEHPDPPAVVHLLDPELPSRGDLVGHMKERNPDLKVVWLPRLAVRPLGLLATALQKALRPGTEVVDVAAVFADRRYDTSRAAALDGSTSSEKSTGPVASSGRPAAADQEAINSR